MKETTERAQQLYDALESMVWQFGHYANGRFHTGGLSALEEAFGALGWKDPHDEPAGACDEPGCGERATCGIPTPAKYRSVCGKHYGILAKETK